MNNITFLLVFILLFGMFVFIIETNRRTENKRISNQHDENVNFINLIKELTTKKDELLSKDPLPEQMQDDIIDVYDADPGKLLKSLQQKDDDIEDKN